MKRFLMITSKEKRRINLPLNNNQPLFPIVPFFSYDMIFSMDVSTPENIVRHY